MILLVPQSHALSWVLPVSFLLCSSLMNLSSRVFIKVRGWSWLSAFSPALTGEALVPHVPGWRAEAIGCELTGLRMWKPQLACAQSIGQTFGVLGQWEMISFYSVPHLLADSHLLSVPSTSSLCHPPYFLSVSPHPLLCHRHYLLCVSIAPVCVVPSSSLLKICPKLHVKPSGSAIFLSGSFKLMVHFIDGYRTTQII